VRRWERKEVGRKKREEGGERKRGAVLLQAAQAIWLDWDVVRCSHNVAQSAEIPAVIPLACSHQ